MPKNRLFTKVAIVPAVACALAVGAMTPAAQASPGPNAAKPAAHAGGQSSAASDPSVTWNDFLDGRYLEIYQAATGNGAYADAYPRNGGSNQVWNAVSHGFTSGGQERWAFINEHSGLCLEDRGYRTGTLPVDQWSCGSYGNNALWVEIGPVYLNAPAYELKNLGNNEYACVYNTRPDYVRFSTSLSNGCYWE